MKIGLLVTDIPPDSVRSKYGDYFEMFSKVYADGLKSLQSKGLIDASIQLQLVPFDVINQQYPQTELDGYIITGSKFSAYEEASWIERLKAFIRETKSKFVGICFGHQVIAEALGGKVEKNSRGWEVGWTEMELNEQGSELLNAQKVALFQMHQDIVTKVPEGAVNLASSSVCLNQLIMKPGSFLSIQSHPEFVPGVVEELIKLRLEKGIFTEEQATKWRAVLNNPADSLWFVEHSILFLLDQ